MSTSRGEARRPARERPGAWRWPVARQQVVQLACRQQLVRRAARHGASSSGTATRPPVHPPAGYQPGRWVAGQQFVGRGPPEGPCRATGRPARHGTRPRRPGSPGSVIRMNAWPEHLIRSRRWRGSDASSLWAGGARRLGSCGVGGRRCRQGCRQVAASTVVRSLTISGLPPCCPYTSRHDEMRSMMRGWPTQAMMAVVFNIN